MFLKGTQPVCLSDAIDISSSSRYSGFGVHETSTRPVHNFSIRLMLVDFKKENMHFWVSYDSRLQVGSFEKRSHVRSLTHDNNFSKFII